METQTKRTHPVRRGSAVAIALVSTMLCLMLLLAAVLIGFAGASLTNKSTGDLSSTTGNKLQLTRRHLAQMQADNLADAGVRAAVQWISLLPGPPTSAARFGPGNLAAGGKYDFFPTAVQTTDPYNWTTVGMPGGSNDDPKNGWKVRFYPHATNAGSAQKSYVLECVATYNDITSTVRADIQQQSFTRYAYFTDDIGVNMLAGHTQFNGPVHINNPKHSNINIVWNDGSLTLDQARIFDWSGNNTFTMWQGEDDGHGGHLNDNKINWLRNTVTNPSAPSTDAEWHRVSFDGIRDLPIKVPDKVEMPISSSNQLYAAIGGEGSTEPTVPGVTVPNNGGTVSGGVYIRGAVDSMVLQAAGTNNTDQIVYVYQGANNTDPTNTETFGQSTTKYKITMTATGTTLEKYTRDDVMEPFPKSPSFATAYSGATNGVIYARDGVGYNGGDDTGTATPAHPRVGGVHGTIANSVVDANNNVVRANALNIVARNEAGAATGINIDGNIQYANVDHKAQQAKADSGILGIVGGYVKVVGNQRQVEPRVTGFENTNAADAKPNTSALASDTTLTNVAVHATLFAYNTIDVENPATRPLGSFQLVGGYIASKGSKFGDTNATTLNLQNGFERNLSYDKRVFSQPPPAFPGAAQNYQFTSYQRVTTTLESP